MLRTTLILLITVALLSCRGNKATATGTSAEANTSTTNSVDTVVVLVEQEPENKDSLLIAYSKTPCFGKCPVYKVNVYNSGYATYEGINFTEKMGMYTGKLSEVQISKIFNKASQINYFSLKDEYDSNVTDLPTTYSTLVSEDGTKKKIKARHNIPSELKNFYAYLEDVFEEVDWKAEAER